MAATKGTTAKTMGDYRLPPLQLRYYQALSSSIYNVNIGLSKLAGLGRPGLWVLHNEDLYRPEYDTRPGSRNPDKVVSIEQIEYHGVPLLRAKTLHWSGSGPMPDFLSIDFWREAKKRLDEQRALVAAGSVQPQFTPSELQALEELESQPNHALHHRRNNQQTKMADCKDTVFRLLFELAQLGRPGRWILHQEELFHPVIDTRPESRNAATAKNVKHVVIRDSTFLGVEVEACQGVFADFEVHWSGTEAQPDFDDVSFWQHKDDDLSEKIRDVRAGLVKPGFSPDELRRLEAMENDRSHAFAVMPLLVPEPQTPELIPPEERARLIGLDQLKYNIVESLINLWDSGLAGKWVLHNEDLYLPERDTVNRAQPDESGIQGSGDIHITNLIVEESTGLRLDIRRAHPLPDFEDPEYWREKDADLRKKLDDIEAGRRTGHKFTKADLVRIALLERALEKSHDERENRVGDNGSNPAAGGGVLAWLNGGAAHADGVPEPEDQGTPIQSPGAAEERTAAAIDVEKPPSASSKRKRGARNTEHNQKPAGRSTQRTKDRPEPNKKSPPTKQSTRRASRKPPSPPPVPLKKTPKTKVAKVKASHSGDTQKDGSPVRRSARIKALVP